MLKMKGDEAIGRSLTWDSERDGGPHATWASSMAVRPWAMGRGGEIGGFFGRPSWRAGGALFSAVAASHPSSHLQLTFQLKLQIGASPLLVSLERRTVQQPVPVPAPLIFEPTNRGPRNSCPHPSVRRWLTEPIMCRPAPLLPLLLPRLERSWRGRSGNQLTRRVMRRAAALTLVRRFSN